MPSRVSGHRGAASLLAFALLALSGCPGKNPPIPTVTEEHPGCGYQYVPFQPPGDYVKVVRTEPVPCRKAKHEEPDPATAASSYELKIFTADDDYVIVDLYRDSKVEPSSVIPATAHSTLYYLLIEVLSKPRDDRDAETLQYLVLTDPRQAYGWRRNYCVHSKATMAPGPFRVSLYESSDMRMFTPGRLPTFRRSLVGPEYFREPLVAEADLICSPKNEGLFAIPIMDERIAGTKQDARLSRRPFGVRIVAAGHDDLYLQVIPNPLEEYTVMRVEMQQLTYGSQANEEPSQDLRPGGTGQKAVRRRPSLLKPSSPRQR